MLRFTVRRLAQTVFVMIALSIITFVIFNVIPNGDPALRLAGRTPNPIVVQQIREDFGFNDPLYVQYGALMSKTFNGELESYSNGTNVREELLRAVCPTPPRW